MNKEKNELADLLDRFIEKGNVSEVPIGQQADLEQALAAHQALQGLIDETLSLADTVNAHRQPPTLTADYQIERELGAGGMGVVYLARQKSLNRLVAVKVLRPGRQRDAALVKRFLGEAQHLARLKHPHIVAIHEVGQSADEPYFTMDFVDGQSLSSLLAQGPLPPSQAIAIIKAVAAAIEFAHRHGIIHRDLKPSNVLLDSEGQVFVTDFGLARDVRQDSALTQSGELLGTPQYMSPEQARGQSESIGEATDIHALGLLLYEMLTGRPAFSAASQAEILVKLLNESPQPPRRLDRRIPLDLETICLKCLEKSAELRYANVSALLEDLRRFEAGQALTARRTAHWVLALRWIKRRWALVLTAAVTAALVLSLVWPLMDKSFQELVTWGDEELASGNFDEAARIYKRAWRKASTAEMAQLTPRIVQTCRNLPDSDKAVELALLVIESVPETSFGAHDYLIAMTLLGRQRAKSPSKSIDVWTDEPSPQLQLVKTRLDMALAAPLPDAQRHEVESALTAINLILNAEAPWSRAAPEYLFKLPTGSEEVLSAQVDDPQQPLWNRGRAALALAKRHDQTGRKQEAVRNYQQAYEFMRQVYPMYGGVTAAGGSRYSRVGAPDAEECGLVREVVTALRRLAPDSLPLPQGGLEFSLVGLTLPDTMGFDLVVELCDPEIEDPNAGLPHRLPRLVPLRSDAPVSVRVLDGRYRLRVRGHHARWDDTVAQQARLLEIDVLDWPDEIEVRGQMLRLPDVVLRQASLISGRAPEPGQVIDLNQLELTWDEVPEAVRYQVMFEYNQEQPSPISEIFLSVTVGESRLSLADLPATQRSQIQKNWTIGCSAGWTVDAYDARDRRIGRMLKPNPFTIGRELEAQP